MAAPTPVPSPEAQARHPERILPPLQNATVASLLAKVQRSVVFPILLAALISGIGRDVMLVSAGVIACSLWLLWDLYPWAEWWSIRIANRKYSVLVGPTRSAQLLRRQKQREVKSWILGFMCAAVFAVAYVAIHMVRMRHVAEVREDVKRELVGTLSLPLGRTLNNSKFTITNTSSHEVVLKQLKCTPVYFRTTGNAVGVNPFSSVDSDEVVLHANGDSQSMNCPDNRVLHLMPSSDGTPADLFCADVRLNATYVIADIPAKSETKSLRYVLHPGEHEWSGTALDALVPPCT